MEVLSRLRSSKFRNILLTSSSKEDVTSTGLDVHAIVSEDASLRHVQRKSSLDTRPERLEGESAQGAANLSHSYSTEWENMFLKSDMLQRLKEKAMEGNLRSSRFRSVAWKIFLEVLPSDIRTWSQITLESRNKFEELKNRLIVNPRKAVDSIDLVLNNPLSQDEESPWNKFFQDNELRLTIKQDVIRTYPKIEFFQSNQLRNLMVDILFIFAKENLDISYRQGMHELLAPLIFVLHCDHQAFLHACELETSLCSRNPVMKEVLDPAFLEHDAYTMFCRVMSTVEPWYLSRDIFNVPMKNGSSRSLDHLNAIPFCRSPDLNPSSVIVSKLSRIQDPILREVDPDLHQHLQQLEIVPQIYGIRWLRLLFGREFTMQDLLMLWDAIFGDGIRFDLVDYIFVAMLLYLRDILLTSDYTACLTVLMKFPPVADVHYFVAKALWIREPDLYTQPGNYTHQGSIRASTGSMVSSSENVHNLTSNGGGHSRHQGQGLKREASGLGGFSSFSRKFSRPRTLSVPKSSSEPMNLLTDVSPNNSTSLIGSTVSLSHVEESMYRRTTLASSLAQLENSNLRSAQSSPGIHQSAIFPTTPDDMSITSSPPKYYNQARLQNKGRELNQISSLQAELKNKNSMCRYCASKLDVHIVRLQQDLAKLDGAINQDVMLSLAGIKLVRDILNGTILFSQKIAADDDDIPLTDEYNISPDGRGDYSNTNVTSPESDILLHSSCVPGPPQQATDRFYLPGNNLSSSDLLQVEDSSLTQNNGFMKGDSAEDLNNLHRPGSYIDGDTGRTQPNRNDRKLPHSGILSQPHTKDGNWLHSDIHDKKSIQPDLKDEKLSIPDSRVKKQPQPDVRDRQLPLEKTLAFDGDGVKSLAAPINITSKFLRMFKTDSGSDVAVRPLAPTNDVAVRPLAPTNDVAVRPLAPTKQTESRYKPNVDPVVPVSSLSSMVSAADQLQPQATESNQATARVGAPHQYSGQWERELQVLDSQNRARFHVRNPTDWFHFSSNSLE